MPQVGFEPTIPVFERAKTVHVLDRAATVIGWNIWSSALKSVTAVASLMLFMIIFTFELYNQFS
jgi:hypothetical protein